MGPPSLEERDRTNGLAATWVVAGTAAATLLVLALIAMSSAIAAPPELRFFDPRRAPTVDEAWAVSVMDYAFSSNEKNDVIFLGDSACRSAAEPMQFERLTQLRAYNLGVLFGGLGPEVLHQVARSYLAKHPAPRLFVFSPSPVCFEKDVPASYVQLRNRFLDCYRFENPELGSLDGILKYLASAAYMLRQGTLLAWDKATSSLGGQSHDVRDDPLFREKEQTYRTLERTTREKRGYYTLTGSGHIQSLDRPDKVVGVRDDWDQGLRRLAETCEKAHVPLMIHFSPISAEASKTLDFSHVEAWLADLQATYPHLILLRDRAPVCYPSDLCFDAIHLNVQGTKKFTPQLAREVREALEQIGNSRKG